MKARGIVRLAPPSAGAWAERSRGEYGVPQISTDVGLGTAVAEGALVVVEDGVDWIEEAPGR
jgi:hypothetical protein